MIKGQKLWAVILLICIGMSIMPIGLPKEWKTGSLRGVKVTGGHKIDVTWENGRVAKINIAFGYTEKITFSVNDKIYEFCGNIGEKRTINLLENRPRGRVISASFLY